MAIAGQFRWLLVADSCGNLYAGEADSGEQLSKFAVVK
jgi:hypothetical protein